MLDPKSLLGLEELTPMETGEVQGGGNKEKKKEKEVDVEIDVEVGIG